MFMTLTPFSSIIFFLYISLLSLLPIVSDFFFFILLMEISMLLLIGFSLLLFVNSFSHLMFFFLVQVIASFNIIIGFILGFDSFILLSLFLKTAMFPFTAWFLSVAYRFPNLVLFIVSTFNNLPSMLLFYQFINVMSSFLIICVVLNLLIVSVIMFMSNDLRFMLITSSCSSTVWFIISLQSSPLPLFLIFFSLYSSSLFFSFLFIGPLSNFSISLSFLTLPHRVLLFMALSNLAAFPPLPLFLFKLLILYNFLFDSSFFPFFEVFLILVTNAIIIASYVNCYLKFFIISFTSSSSFFL